MEPSQLKRTVKRKSTSNDTTSDIYNKSNKQHELVIDLTGDDEDDIIVKSEYNIERESPAVNAMPPTSQGTPSTLQALGDNTNIAGTLQYLRAVVDKLPIAQRTNALMGLQTVVDNLPGLNGAGPLRILPNELELISSQSGPIERGACRSERTDATSEEGRSGYIDPSVKSEPQTETQVPQTDTVIRESIGSYDVVREQCPEPVQLVNQSSRQECGDDNSGFSCHGDIMDGDDLPSEEFWTFTGDYDDGSEEDATCYDKDKRQDSLHNHVLRQSRGRRSTKKDGILCPYSDFKGKSIRKYIQHLGHHSWQCSNCSNWQMGYTEYKYHFNKCKNGETATSTPEVNLVNGFCCLICKVFIADSRRQLVEHMKKDHCRADSSETVLCPLCHTDITSDTLFSHLKKNCSMFALCNASRTQQDIDRMIIKPSTSSPDKSAAEIGSIEKLLSAHPAEAEPCIKCGEEVPYADMFTHLLEHHKWKCYYCAQWSDGVSVSSFRQHIDRCENLPSSNSKDYNALHSFLNQYDAAYVKPARRVTSSPPDLNHDSSSKNITEVNPQSHFRTEEVTPQSPGNADPNSAAKVNVVNSQTRRLKRRSFIKAAKKLEASTDSQDSPTKYVAIKPKPPNGKTKPSNILRSVKLPTNQSQASSSATLDGDTRTKSAVKVPVKGPAKAAGPFTCAQCGRIFTLPGSYGRHLTYCGHHAEQTSTKIYEPNNGIYKCPVCPEQFAQARLLKRHMESEVGHVFKCGTCSGWFKEEDRQRHKHSCEVTENVEQDSTVLTTGNCPICKIYSSDSKKSMANHIIYHHQVPKDDKDDIVCPCCAEIVGKEETDLRQHLIRKCDEVETTDPSSDATKTFQCSVCCRVYQSISALNLHRRRIGHVWKCQRCEQWFKEQEWKSHTFSKCEGADPTEQPDKDAAVPKGNCPVCKVHHDKFIHRLANHIVYHHKITTPDGQIQCSCCSKLIGGECDANFKSHIIMDCERFHTDEGDGISEDGSETVDQQAARHRCHVCKEVFPTIDSLRYHNNRIGHVKQCRKCDQWFKHLKMMNHDPEMCQLSNAPETNREIVQAPADACQAPADTCPICTIHSSCTAGRLAYHIVYNHKVRTLDGRLACPCCNTVIGDSEIMLLDHLLKSCKSMCIKSEPGSNGMEYKCFVCDRTYCTANRLSRHINSHVWQCSKCKGWFQELLRYSHNVAKCQGKVVVDDVKEVPADTCPICKIYSTKKKHTLSAHIVVQHKIKRVGGILECPCCHTVVGEGELLLQEHLSVRCEKLLARTSAKTVKLGRKSGDETLQPIEYGQGKLKACRSTMDDMDDEDMDDGNSSEEDDEDNIMDEPTSVSRPTDKKGSSKSKTVAVTRTRLLTRGLKSNNKFQMKASPCHICGQGTFDQHHKYIEHMVQNHHIVVPKGRIQCQDCLKLLELDTTFYSHQKSGHCIRVFFHCDKCEKIFKTAKSLANHEMEKHPTGKGKSSHNCGICGDSFHTRTLLRKHRMIHPESKFYRSNLYPCMICDTKCITKFDRVFHEQHEHFRDGKCVFQNCHYKLSTRLHWRLRFKMATHIAQCHPAAASPMHLCKYGCTKRFVTAVELEAHRVERHSVKKVYKCPSCSFEGNSSSSMSIHKTAYHSERTYDCEQCEFSCKWHTSLMRHKRTVHGSGNQYLCHLCGQTFSQKGSVTRHMKTAHTVCSSAEVWDVKKTNSCA